MSDHRATVVDGEIQFLSVSQVQKFRRCARSWRWNKVERIPEPTSKSQQVGIDGHAQLEHYLKTGENGLGPVALAGVDALPAPGPDLLVEVPFVTHAEVPSPVSLDGIPFRGFIDLVNPRALESGLLTIADHKFSSDPWKYGALAEHLTDPNENHGIQMLGYGTWAVRSGIFPGLRQLELAHHYYATRGKPRARRVAAVIDAAEVVERWDSLTPIAKAMREAARAPSPFDVAPTWSACSAFGGCPHLSRCLNAAPTTKKDEKTMGLMDRLKQNNAHATVTAPVAQTAAPAPTEDLAPNTTEAKNARTGVFYRLPDGREGEFLIETRGRFLFAVNGADPVTLEGDARIGYLPDPAAQPPLATPPPAPTTTIIPEGEVKVSPAEVVEAMAGQIAAVLPPDAPKSFPPVPETQTAPVESAPEAKPKRKRRTKAEMAAARAAEREARGEPAEPDTEGLELFVGCVPNEGAISLADYGAELHDQVASKFGVQDVRVSPDKNSPLAFGGWKGVLAAAARAAPPEAGRYTVLGHSELLDVIVEALAPTASLVVYGVR